MTRITGNHGPLLKKITAAGLVPLLLVAVAKRKEKS